MNKQDPISWKKLEQKWVSRRNLIRGAAGAALGTSLLRANSADAGDDDHAIRDVEALGSNQFQGAAPRLSPLASPYTITR